MRWMLTGCELSCGAMGVTIAGGVCGRSEEQRGVRVRVCRSAPEMGSWMRMTQFLTMPAAAQLSTTPSGFGMTPLPATWRICRQRRRSSARTHTRTGTGARRRRVARAGRKSLGEEPPGRNDRDACTMQ